MDLKTIRESIAQKGVEMRGILDVAKQANRSMNAEEIAKFDAIDKDRDALIETEKRMSKEEEVTRALGASAGRKTEAAPAHEDRTVQVAKSSQDQLTALQGWFLRAKHRNTAEHNAAAQRCGIDLNARTITVNLPAIALRSRLGSEVNDWEARFQGLVSQDTPADGSAGGFTVQYELMKGLEEALLAYGGMREVATIIRTNTGARLPWPTCNDTSEEGEIIGEGDDHNEQDVVFSQLNLDAFKYSSKKLGVSVELLQDSTLNMAQTLGSLLGTRIGRITNRHFTTGSGNGQPKGIVTAAANSNVTLTGSPEAVSYANLVDIEHSVDPAYRVGAKWMFADSTLKLIKKIVTPVTNQPIWMPSLAAGQPDNILGYGFQVNQAMAAVGSPAAKAILFGKLDKYIIRDVREVTLVRLDEVAAEKGLVVFLAFSRHDGDLLDAGTNPVKYAQ